MNIKIKRIGLLIVLTLSVALSTFAQPGAGDYRRDERNSDRKISRERSRNSARSRRSLSFWSVILQLLTGTSNSNRRRNGRDRY